MAVGAHRQAAVDERGSTHISVFQASLLLRLPYVLEVLVDHHVVGEEKSACALNQQPFYSVKQYGSDGTVRVGKMGRGRDGVPTLCRLPQPGLPHGIETSNSVASTLKGTPAPMQYESRCIPAGRPQTYQHHSPGSTLSGRLTLMHLPESSRAM